MIDPIMSRIWEHQACEEVGEEKVKMIGEKIKRNDLISITKAYTTCFHHGHICFISHWIYCWIFLCTQSQSLLSLFFFFDESFYVQQSSSSSSKTVCKSRWIFFLIVILAILRSSPGPGVDGCLENFGDGGGFGVALEEGLLRRPRRRRWPAFGREGAPAAGLLVALLHMETERDQNHCQCMLYCLCFRSSPDSSVHLIFSFVVIRAHVGKHMSVWWTRWFVLMQLCRSSTWAFYIQDHRKIIQAHNHQLSPATNLTWHVLISY